MPYLTGVREARVALGVREGRVVKVSDLAALVGCSRAHLVAIESGTKPASPELTALIADKLGVEYASLKPQSKAQLSVPDEPPPQPKPQPKPRPKGGSKGPKRPEGEAA